MWVDVYVCMYVCVCVCVCVCARAFLWVIVLWLRIHTRNMGHCGLRWKCAKKCLPHHHHKKRSAQKRNAQKMRGRKNAKRISFASCYFFVCVSRGVFVCVSRGVSISTCYFVFVLIHPDSPVFRYSFPIFPKRKRWRIFYNNSVSSEKKCTDAFFFVYRSIYFTLYRFFTTAVRRGFSLKSDWQQVSSDLQDFSKYSQVFINFFRYFDNSFLWHQLLLSIDIISLIKFPFRFVLFVWVLWYINHCSLFNVKSSLYIRIYWIYRIWFGFFV